MTVAPPLAPGVRAGPPRKEPLVAAGGVVVERYTCCAGPSDPAFEETRTGTTVAFIRSGAFSYTRDGERHAVYAGSVLLGRPGDTVRVGHDHTHGDAGVIFAFTPDVLEDVARAEGALGVPSPFFTRPVLPPTPRAAALAAAVEKRIALLHTPAEWAPLACDLVAAVLRAEADLRGSVGAARPSAIARRRVREALREIEAHVDAPVDLPTLAATAGLSAYHFIRVFRAETGTTPHQLQVRLRLQRAARLLADTDRPVADVALEAGFGDLAHFSRTFRATIGLTPTGLRGAARGVPPGPSRAPATA